MLRTPVVVRVLLLSASLARPAAAQSPLEKVIGTDENGDQILITALEPSIVGKVAKAAGAPMGIEIAPGAVPKSQPRKLTGLTVRAALEVFSEIDPRYEWREIDGVIVLRTLSGWGGLNHPLDLPVQSLDLRNIRARNALSVVAAFLGAPQYTSTQLSDNKRFSVHLNGGTVLNLLNAVVSAHGELAWSFQAKGVNETELFPYMVTIYAGGTGNGCGVPGQRSFSPVNVERYLDSPALGIAGSNAVLDRIVGIGPNELPLVVNGPYPSAVRDLANATRVPMGIEFLGPGRRPSPRDIPATGRTLREVLDAMIAVDTRYQWREMNGVVVIRPVAAWNDPHSLLLRIVEPVQMIDVTPNVAIERLARAVGSPNPITGFSGTLLSLDLPQGTVLDLATAISRAHGELTWTLTPRTILDDVRYRYEFEIEVMGGSGLIFGAR